MLKSSGLWNRGARGCKRFRSGVEVDIEMTRARFDAGAKIWREHTCYHWLFGELEIRQMNDRVFTNKAKDCYFGFCLVRVNSQTFLHTQVNNVYYIVCKGCAATQLARAIYWMFEFFHLKG